MNSIGLVNLSFQISGSGSTVISAWLISFIALIWMKSFLNMQSRLSLRTPKPLISCARRWSPQIDVNDETLGIAKNHRFCPISIQVSALGIASVVQLFALPFRANMSISHVLWMAENIFRGLEQTISSRWYSRHSSNSLLLKKLYRCRSHDTIKYLFGVCIHAY